MFVFVRTVTCQGIKWRWHFKIGFSIWAKFLGCFSLVFFNVLYDLAGV